MNDPNKVINVNLSSLLSLKAELLRKQAEVSKAKTERLATNDFRRKVSSNSGTEKTRNKSESKKIEKTDEATVYEHEDSLLWEKSQRVLEAKSKFYERMTRNGGSLNSDDNCLVMFNRKKQENEADPRLDAITGTIRNAPSSDDSSSNSEDDDSVDNDDWVEFIDCLGRTRKCLRKDLEDLKRKDAKLAASMPERLDQTKANWMIDTAGAQDSRSDEPSIGPLPPESVFSDGCSLVSKLDEQRANWERKEIENLDKSDVHYQDVFFDEARQHGVGYYAFSTDEAERKKQQEQLESARQRTIAAQKQRDEMRMQREKIIAERVLAAKNRQRARQGLPPIEEDLEKQSTVVEASKPETKEERKERRRAEKLKRRQEQEERKRELERQEHVRPWDKSKVAPTKSVLHSEEDDTAEWVYKAERLPMSQEEWNEKQRKERQSEFAPKYFDQNHTTQPQYTPHFEHGQPYHNISTPPPPLSIQTGRPFAHPAFNMPPPPVPESSFNSFQSTKMDRSFRKRNYESDNQNVFQQQGTAIPPPLDLDLNISPSDVKAKKTASELESSIEAGLRFLRNNCDKATMSTKSSWTAKADY